MATPETIEWSKESVKALRQKKDLTQAELAEALDVTIRTVSRWETDKSHPDNRAAKALNRINSSP